jgi:RNA methyltransferase, TrmH family
LRKIASDKNPSFQQWRELQHSRGIKRYKQLIVSGRKIVPEILQDPHSKVIAVLHSTKTGAIDVPAKVNQFELEPVLFKELDGFGTDFPLLVMETPDLRRIDLAAPPQGLEVLCGLSDPLNVGSLLRAALAFDVQNVILLKESASPFHPRAFRASSGAALKVPMSIGPSLKDLSQNSSWSEHLVVLDQDGQDVGAYSWPKNIRLLLGEEGLGVPTELRRENCLSIPMSGKVESLNAVSAASIAFYLYRQKNQ